MNNWAQHCSTHAVKKFGLHQRCIKKNNHFIFVVNLLILKIRYHGTASWKCILDLLHLLNFIWYEESIEGNICSIWILSSRKARLDLSPTFTSLLICLVGNSSWWCFENDLFSDVDIICLCWRQSLVFFPGNTLE